jgi:hypothetical protein
MAYFKELSEMFRGGFEENYSTPVITAESVNEIQTHIRMLIVTSAPVVIQPSLRPCTFSVRSLDSMEQSPS